MRLLLPFICGLPLVSLLSTFASCNPKLLPKGEVWADINDTSTEVSEDPFGNRNGQTLLNLSVI